MDIYSLNRSFWNWAFENPEKISPNHAAIYYFAIEHCNRLGWKEKFGFPSQMTMDALGIKKHSTYIRYFNDLVDFGFFKLVQKSKNQYSANIISLTSAMPKKGEALDKAMLKHAAKQTESNGQSKGSIDRQLYKETNLQEQEELEDEEQEEEEEKNKPIGKKDFLLIWNTKRKEILKTESNLNRIPFDLFSDLKEISTAYSKEQIETALTGLFKQRKFPNGNTSMHSNPRHFLKYFESYLTAGNDKNKYLYGKPETEKML